MVKFLWLQGKPSFTRSVSLVMLTEKQTFIYVCWKLCARGKKHKIVEVFSFECFHAQYLHLTTVIVGY